MQKHFMILLSLLLMGKNHFLYATAYDPKMPDHGIMSLDYDGFIDPQHDYTKNVGRITDINQPQKMFKVKVENDTTRFLKTGDVVSIKIPNLSKNSCDVGVISTEISYVTFGWQSLDQCWDTKKYFRRGLLVEMNSSIMQLRVQQASAYRKQLLERRNVYLKQLNDVNNFFWKYETERERVLNEYDRKINELKNQRAQAAGSIDDERVNKTKVQGELMQELNSLDELLKFYRIDRREVFSDKTGQDYDTSAPVNQKNRVLQ